MRYLRQRKNPRIKEVPKVLTHQEEEKGRALVTLGNGH